MLSRDASLNLHGPDFGAFVASLGRMEAASRSERIVLFHSSPVWLPWEWQSYEHQFVVILFHLQSMPISFEVYSISGRPVIQIQTALAQRKGCCIECMIIDDEHRVTINIESSTCKV